MTYRQSQEIASSAMTAEMHSADHSSFRTFVLRLQTERLSMGFVTEDMFSVWDEAKHWRQYILTGKPGKSFCLCAGAYHPEQDGQVVFFDITQRGLKQLCVHTDCAPFQSTEHEVSWTNTNGNEKMTVSLEDAHRLGFGSCDEGWEVFNDELPPDMLDNRMRNTYAIRPFHILFPQEAQRYNSEREVLRNPLAVVEADAIQEPEARRRAFQELSSAVSACTRKRVCTEIHAPAEEEDRHTRELALLPRPLKKKRATDAAPTFLELIAQDQQAVREKAHERKLEEERMVAARNQ
jgi:hypothetical protein